MTDIPGGIYLAHRPVEISKILPSDKKHICIDSDQLGELVLRLTLGLQGILPSRTPKLYGYFSIEKNTYYFLNEDQHQYLQSLQEVEEIPCEVKDGAR